MKKTPDTCAILITSLGFSLCAVSSTSSQTIQDFDILNPGSSSCKQQHACPPGPSPSFLEGGPTDSGKFVRLAFSSPIPNQTSITFARTDIGSYGLVVADFDLRLTPGMGRADGFGFALLNTGVYKITGCVPPLAPMYAAEAPDFVGSIGVGFDIHRAEDGLGGFTELNNNHISIHFDGNLVSEHDATNAVNLAVGEWIHVRIEIRSDENPPNVSVLLTPCGSLPIAIVDRLPVPGLAPYEGRVRFSARSGGQSADHDLDNVRVHFLNESKSIFSFNHLAHANLESSGETVITVNRSGSISEPVSVDYSTSDIEAIAGVDYVAALNETLSFVAGEQSKTITISLVDDSNLEGNESFLVSLINPTVGTVVGGPAVTKVTIIDDEQGRQQGHWSDVLCTQIVGVHLNLLPDGQVLFWPGDTGEGGSSSSTFIEPRIWSPTSGTFEIVPAPHNLFCSGHCFLPDGKLLVTGGHLGLNEGLPNAATFDFATTVWSATTLMNNGRWYPTNTSLSDGNVMVMSGSVNPLVNAIPQIWMTETQQWRDLVNAQAAWHLYPMNFVVPDGRVFVAGPDQLTHFVETSGFGTRTDGPSSLFGIRTDGSAVMYQPGQVMIVGGASGIQPPTNTAEIIDLDASEPSWLFTNPMTNARKYHNATLLPDGNVLITGGTSAPFFNDASSAVFDAELWNPTTEQWTILAPLQVPRVYHSTAILLPDGRVLVAGGGQPAAIGHDIDNTNAEIFSPPYMFASTRPAILSAPEVIRFGKTFFVDIVADNTIDRVVLIRLSSVTHAFNQNQRLISLGFSKSVVGLNVNGPSQPSLAPPGHYLLFVVDQTNIPSEAQVVRLSLVACTSDVNGDDAVNVSDLLALLAAWGPNPGHPADINDDGAVNVFDLLAMLAAWGACP